MKIVPTVIGPIFLFFGSGIETLAQTTSNFEEMNVRSSPFQRSYGVTSESLWGTLLSIKQAERRASPQRFSGAHELSNMQFTMSINILFFLSATPLD